MWAAKAANLKTKRKELGENRTPPITGRSFSCKNRMVDAICKKRENYIILNPLEIIYYCRYIWFEKRKFRWTSQRQESHLSQYSLKSKRGLVCQHFYPDMLPGILYFDMLILLVTWDSDHIQEKLILWCSYCRLTSTPREHPCFCPCSLPEMAEWNHQQRSQGQLCSLLHCALSKTKPETDPSDCHINQRQGQCFFPGMEHALLQAADFKSVQMYSDGSAEGARHHGITCQVSNTGWQRTPE